MFVQSLDPNLEVRLLADTEAPILFALVDANRTYLRQWLPWLDSTITQQDSLAFIRLTHEQAERSESLELGVWLSAELVGMAGFIHIDWQNRSASIGYWLAEAHQGSGVITRAVGTLIQHGFGVWGLHRLEIRCATGNQRSCAIPRRLGFTHEGVVREVEWLYDHFVDHQVYGLLAPEWSASIVEDRQVTGDRR